MTNVEGGGRGALRKESYPRQVRQMLMSRSAPHPAIRKTPRGGTVGKGDGVSMGRYRNHISEDKDGE